MTESDVIARPVPVEVKNYADLTVKPRVVKNTTFRTYILDPLGNDQGQTGVAPQRVQITDYEPDRIRTLIQVFDCPVAVTLETPNKSPDNPGLAQSIAPQGRLLLPSASVVHELWGPDALWLNALQLPVSPVVPNLSGVVDSLTAQVAATNAGSINSPAAGESVSSFGVDFQAPGAAVAMQITLSNVLGGPYVWTVTVPTTGLIWRSPFVSPIPASSAAVFPTLAVGAQAGGPAYTLSLQLLKTNTLARVTVTREYAR